MTETSIAAEMYLDLLKRCLTGSLAAEHYRLLQPQSRLRQAVVRGLNKALGRRGIKLVKSISERDYAEGRGWPTTALTMVGEHRLDNLQTCITDVINRGVAGDLLEAGVWRGGASIFMRGVLKAYGDPARRVWAADSFQGLPRPNASQYPADESDRHWTYSELAVSVDDVKTNFDAYGLLDERVQFLVGWFRDTLPTAPIDRLAVLRLDGDLYESTMDTLQALYPKVSAGGYIIVDDFGAIPACREAVLDYRSENGVEEEVQKIDWTGVYWKKTQ